jgi:hypothetical protein
MKNKELEDRQNTVNHLKKENRKARKMLAEYQLMMRTGASGMHKVSNMGCCGIKIHVVESVYQII